PCRAIAAAAVNRASIISMTTIRLIATHPRRRIPPLQAPRGETRLSKPGFTRCERNRRATSARGRNPWYSYYLRPDPVNNSGRPTVLSDRSPMKVSKILTRWVAVVILVSGAGTTALAQRGKWWQDEQFRRELALTAEQSAR